MSQWMSWRILTGKSLVLVRLCSPLQLFPRSPASSRCSPRHRFDAMGRDTTGWRDFLKPRRMDLRSTLRQWQVERAKEKAAAFNTANARALVPVPEEMALARVEKARTAPVVRSRRVAQPIQAGSSYVRRPGFHYMGQLMECEIAAGEARCTYTGGHTQWQCFLPATRDHPLGATEQPLQQLCTIHYVSCEQ